MCSILQVGIFRSVAMAILIATVGRPVAGQSEASLLFHRRAPNFSRLDIISHRTTRLSDSRGKVVLLDFWATWCAPCLTEMPVFNGWQQQFGTRNFQVIAISMDDDAADVVPTVSRLRLTFPVLLGDEHIAAAYGGILGLPVCFLIDRQGRVSARYDGVAASVIERDLQRLLRSP